MKIIINADDFGITEELNLCVKRLHEQGIIMSATLIANSPYFEQAIQIAKECPNLGIGVHLTLDGPYNTLKESSSIINPYNNQFYDLYYTINKLKKYGFDSNDIYKEYNSQIQNFLNNGIKITHIDHHHHLHLYLQSLQQVIKISRKYKIKSIRSQNILIPLNKSLLNKAYRSIHQVIVKRKFISPDGYFELVQSVKDLFLKFSIYQITFSIRVYWF
jgi:predicted glycoside hydrolase/deacetylase ChbG (UPF0249 family)